MRGQLVMTCSREWIHQNTTLWTLIHGQGIERCRFLHSIVAPWTVKMVLYINNSVHRRGACSAAARLRLSLSGLMVTERNWLLVYRWASWGGNSNLPAFVEGQQFQPNELTLRQGATAPPPRLSERDLIAAMERHGIGTDATVAGDKQHLGWQQQRHGLCSVKWLVCCCCCNMWRYAGGVLMAGCKRGDSAAWPFFTTASYHDTLCCPIAVCAKPSND